MPRKLRLLLPLLILVTAAPFVRAQDGTTTPAAGSPERKAIADALRAPVERELKQKVIFKIESLKLKGDWAFLRGVPQRIEDGVFDDGVVALLRKRAGKWQVVKYVIGATDVPYVTWDKDYKAPSAIFN